MITKFKIFENNWASYKDVIYRCADFQVKEDFTYESLFVASNILKKLPDLIIDNNFAISDYDFQSIEISSENKKIFIMHYISLDDNKIKNIKEHNSGLVGEFIFFDEFNGRKKYEFVKSINSDVYIQLILKYHPIIEEIIKNSETLGDVVIEYRKIIPKINKDLELFTQTNIYNL